MKKCDRVTKNGSQCTRRIHSDGEFCWQHSDKNPIDISEDVVELLYNSLYKEDNLVEFQELFKMATEHQNKMMVYALAYRKYDKLQFMLKNIETSRILPEDTEKAVNLINKLSLSLRDNREEEYEIAQKEKSEYIRAALDSVKDGTQFIKPEIDSVSNFYELEKLLMPYINAYDPAIYYEHSRKNYFKCEKL